MAVLVDEYDKPLLESMHNPTLEESNRAALKALYSVLKDADEHLRFAFITGVTKFSKVSIFSDLNQLRDITLSREYAGVCGITEPELISTFDPELDAMAAELDTGREGCLAALRAQYDGYRFHPSGPDVYNPYSLLNALTERTLGSYWFATGTPTFLVHRMQEAGLDPRRLTDGTIYVEEDRLSDYRADDPDPIPLLFQTGYLTIHSRDLLTGEFELTVPNGEVEWGLLKSLLPAYAPGYGAARGRADCVVEARAHVYVMEFKRDGTAAEALEQIVRMGYAAPFEADPRELHVIGCSFDSSTRLLAEWEEL